LRPNGREPIAILQCGKATQEKRRAGTQTRTELLKIRHQSGIDCGIHQAQGNGVRVCLSYGRKNFSYRKVRSQVSHVPTFGRGGSASQHGAQLVSLTWWRRDNQPWGSVSDFVNPQNPPQRSTDNPSSEVLVRNRDTPFAPALPDFPKSRSNYLVEKSRDAECYGSALQNRVKLRSIEPASGIESGRPEILRSGDSG